MKIGFKDFWKDVNGLTLKVYVSEGYYRLLESLDRELELQIKAINNEYLQEVALFNSLIQMASILQSLYIAQAPVNKNGEFKKKVIVARKCQHF
jgi:hypothetical protein